MYFEIEHDTQYRYSEPVFLDPHLLRIRPRTDWCQRLTTFDLEISPAPDGIARLVDLDGNETVQPWFSGTHDHLRIVARSKVETLVSDPYAYLLGGDADHLPVTYNEEGGQLVPYLPTAPVPDGPVLTLARQIRQEAEGATIPFLGLLNGRIRELCPTQIRLEGDPLTPEQTLERGGGACRDVAVLFMAACRAVGLATRFTSGYIAGELQEERYLHAWAEVYLPGAGWRGYDPSLGLVVTDRHVALASGPTAVAARPFVGRFRGTGAVSEMTVNLKIRNEEAGPVAEVAAG